METVDVGLPRELLRAAHLEESSLSQEAARLLALELCREQKLSLGRAAELCQTPLAAFSWILRQSTLSPRYATALRTWKENAARLIAESCDCRIRFIALLYTQTIATYIDCICCGLVLHLL
jgi:predicted HTH domain antitoxin